MANQDSFIPTISKYIADRMEFVPGFLRGFCGDLSGLEILDVGCGDMIADMGILSLNPKRIYGLDIGAAVDDVVEHARCAAENNGYAVPADYRFRLSHGLYDGVNIPFPDNRFDFVLSWGTFEHVLDVPAVLRELRRVVKPSGRIFATIFPWFHCYEGSHLSDFIEEPFFHLSRPTNWVKAKLEEYATRHPERRADLDYLWEPFITLNRYSAKMFLNAALEAGLSILKLESEIDESHVADAPNWVDQSDIITRGTTALFHPCKRYGVVAEK